MTALDVAPTPDTDPTRPSHRLSRWATASTVALFALVVGVIAVGWWGSAPPELWPTPTGIGTSSATVGHTYYEDAALYLKDQADDGSPPPTLRFDRIAPRVSENSAQAVVALVVCSRSGGTAIGLAEASQLSLFCSTVRPFTGREELALGFTTLQVLVAITPTTPGVVHIEGLDVTYSSGGRSTTMAAGTDLTLTATR